ncbi:MAG TPA: hypothetical protein VHO48_03330 [Anaerolineaceae bacterium]|nr:hypothetical protein [Anaerolineaceae bacterium]
MDDIIPLETIERTLKQWWLVVALVLTGGLIGSLFHAFRPPLYDARAVLIGSIDFAQTGPLGEIETDYALEAINSLIDSSDVKNQVVAAAQAQQIPVDPQTFDQYLERKSNQIWLLQVRSKDPQAAANLANLWAETAYARLNESLQHAIQARSLEKHLQTLDACLQAAPAAPADQPPCEAASLEQLQTEITTTSAAIQTETDAAHLISSAMSFELSEKAQVPTKPAAFNRNMLVLGGGLIGFLVAILAIYQDWLGKLGKAGRRG